MDDHSYDQVIDFLLEQPETLYHEANNVKTYAKHRRQKASGGKTPRMNKKPLSDEL